MKIKLHFRVLAALILSVNFSAYSTNFYVSETGSNGNNGLTPQTAYETLQYAADVVSAGDSVLVLEGNYVGFDIGCYEFTTTTEVVEENIPRSFQLFQNYPNPFNPSTKIEFRIPENSFVTLKVYDVLGNEVATLVNEYKSTGRYEITFDATDLSSSVYIYQLIAGSYLQTRKMVILK